MRRAGRKVACYSDQLTSGLPALARVVQCTRTRLATKQTLALGARLGQIRRVEASHLNGIHQALSAVHETVGTLTFPRCDQDDVFELIDRVESELGSKHPNVALMCTFLNSIARSLRAQPEAREACLVIEDAIERAGFPSTWQAGI